MATRCSILAWRIPYTKEPGGPQSVGSQRLRHDWATNTLTFHLARFLFGISPRVGISASAGAAVICSLTWSESCASIVRPSGCRQEASLTHPTGSALHTAAHNTVFSRVNDPREGWKPQSQKSDTVASPVHCWSYTSALVGVGGYFMEAWLLREEGCLPLSAPQPAGVPVLSPNPHIQHAHRFPRPSHVSFYDGIILKSRTTSSKAGPGVGGVPWRSLLQHSFLSSLISTCLCSPICPTSQNTVGGQAQGNFCRHSCFLRGKMGDTKASLAHSISEIQMGSIDRAQAWVLLSMFTALLSVLLVLTIFFFFFFHKI